MAAASSPSSFASYLSDLLEIAAESGGSMLVARLMSLPPAQWKGELRRDFDRDYHPRHEALIDQSGVVLDIH